MSFRSILVLALFSGMFGVSVSGAQDRLVYTAASRQELPDAPSSVQTQKKQRSHVEILADDPYRPLTNHQKLSAWTRRSYDPSTFVAAGVDTAFSGITSNMRYCCGADALGRQYAASVADAEARYFFGKFLFPTILDQDPRYLPKRSGGVLQRAWYAATRVLVTRNDEGRNTFNSSELLGIAFSKGLTNAYYPERDRTWGRTANSILGALQGDASGNLLTEFMPDIKRIFTRHAPKRILALGGHLSGSKNTPAN
jgi:hypothetical protein